MPIYTDWRLHSIEQENKRNLSFSTRFFLKKCQVFFSTSEMHCLFFCWKIEFLNLIWNTEDISRLDWYNYDWIKITVNQLREEKPIVVQNEHSPIWFIMSYKSIIAIWYWQVYLTNVTLLLIWFWSSWSFSTRKLMPWYKRMDLCSQVKQSFCKQVYVYLNPR